MLEALSGSSIVLPISIAALLLLLVARRPIGRALARLLRGAAGRGTKPVGGREGLDPSLGVFSSIVWLVRRLSGNSQIDDALTAANGASSTKLTHTWSLFFAYVDPPTIDLRPQITDEEAREYYKESASFFERDVSIEEEPGSLYEEIEGRTIIEMFKARDKSCFAFLNEVRRCVNGNVRRLAMVVPALMCLFLTFVVFEKPIVEWVFGKGYTGWAIIYYEWIAFFVVGVAIAGVAYSQRIAQQQAGREMNDFINRYFGILGQQYENARGTCGLIYTRTAKEEEASERASVWFITLEWIAFRIFFIEFFARNSVFQIRRNSNLYLFYTPLIVFVAYALLSELIANLVANEAFSPLSSKYVWYEKDWVVVVLFVIIAIYSWTKLTAAIASFAKFLNTSEWTGFRSRRYLQTVGALVGQYNREIVFQRKKYKPE